MIDDKIIKYLDKQLSEEERKNFEIQLTESEELRKEVDKYLKLKSEIFELREPETNEIYFNSILPRFRERLEGRRKTELYKKLAYAFSIIIIAAVSLFIFNQIYLSGADPTDLIRFTESLTDSQKVELLSNLENHLSDEYPEELYSDYYQTDLETVLNNIEDKNQVASLYSLEVEEIPEYLSEQELNEIYDELLSMNFIQEENL